MFVASALGVIEHVLWCRTTRLREPGLRLTRLSLGFCGYVRLNGPGRTVELFLLLIEAALLTISDRLLAISKGLFESSDALIGIEVPLCSVGHLFTSPV
jgi:hypothetical protein